LDIFVGGNAMLFEKVLTVVIVYLCAYALVSRICQCIEHCANAKAYSAFAKSGAENDTGNYDDFEMDEEEHPIEESVK
jgi:hypothetical protein